MKRSTQMRKELETIKNQMEQLKNDGKIDEAHAKIEEISAKKKEIEVQEQLEDMEAENFKGAPVENPRDEVDPIVVFNKCVLGKPLTEEERNYADKVYNAAGQKEGEDDKGGYLVPAQQFNEIEELRRKQIELKKYCNVIPVTSNHGKMPIEVGANDKLTDFEELTDITSSTITFGAVEFKTTDYGDIIPISNTLLADEKANLTKFVGKRFSKKAVRTENEKILAIVKTATKMTGNSYLDILTALNVKLDPAISQSAIILTNQTGFDYLDKLVDTQNRPLLTPSLADPTRYVFKGREVVVMSDADIPPVSKKQLFYIGDMAEFVAFFDREEVTMAVSKEAGFVKNATLMRVIERFDVKKVDDKAMVHLELTVA